MSRQLLCACALCALLAAPAHAQMVGPFVPGQAQGLIPNVQGPRLPSPFDGMPGVDTMALPGMRQPNEPPENAPAPTFSPAIEKILAQSEGEIDIGTTALTFSKEISPGLDVAAYSKKIDDLAAEVKALNASYPTPDHLLFSLDTVLYKRHGFQADTSPDFGDRHSNYTLDGLLDTKRGTCGSMTALYIAVAQRVGLKPHPVLAPSHIFARYTFPGNVDQPTLNIEPTVGGTVPDADYVRNLRVSEKSIKTGAYMRTLSYRQYLAVFLFQTGLAMRPSDSPVVRAKSNAFMARALEVDPLDSDISAQLAASYRFEAGNAAAQGRLQAADFFSQQAQVYERRTEQLGHTRVEEIRQWAQR